MQQRRNQGFSFLELFIGIIILFAGIIPIFWVMSGSTQTARLTVSQVQATNHASNLIEAIRAVGFDAVSQFPPIMQQLGKGKWGVPQSLDEVLFAPISSDAPTNDQLKAWDSFEKAFFASDDPIVPPMEDYYIRYFAIRDSGGGAPADPSAPTGSVRREKTLTVIIRVEWTVRRSSNAGEVQKKQHVELRTVLGDPYRSLGGGG